MTRRELRNLIREAIEELKKGNVDIHMGAADRYQSGEFADSEVNREKVYKHWGAANKALLKDKNNFVYMSRDNENPSSTDMLPFSVGKVGSVERFGQDSIEGKMWTSGGPGRSMYPSAIDYAFSSPDGKIWELETFGSGPGEEGKMSFYTERDAGNFLKSLKSAIANSPKVREDPAVIKKFGTIRTRQMKNIGVRKVNMDQKEIEFMNMARDAAAAGEDQSPIAAKYNSRGSEPQQEPQQTAESLTKLKKMIREVVEEVYSQKNEGLRDKIGDFLADPFGKNRKEYEKLQAKNEPIRENNLKFFEAATEAINKKLEDLSDTYRSLRKKLASLPNPEPEKWNDGEKRVWDRDIGEYVPEPTRWLSGGDRYADERKDLTEKLSEIDEKLRELRAAGGEIEQFVSHYRSSSYYYEDNEKIDKIYRLIGGEIVRELRGKGLQVKLHEV